MLLLKHNFHAFVTHYKQVCIFEKVYFESDERIKFKVQHVTWISKNARRFAFHTTSYTIPFYEFFKNANKMKEITKIEEKE